MKKFIIMYMAVIFAISCSSVKHSYVNENTADYEMIDNVDEYYAGSLRGAEQLLQDCNLEDSVKGCNSCVHYYNGTFGLVIIEKEDHYSVHIICSEWESNRRKSHVESTQRFPLEEKGFKDLFCWCDSENQIAYNVEGKKYNPFFSHTVLFDKSGQVKLQFNSQTMEPFQKLNNGYYKDLPFTNDTQRIIHKLMLDKFKDTGQHASHHSSCFSLKNG